MANARFDHRLAIALAILGAVLLLLVNEGAFRQSRNAMDMLLASGSSRTATLHLTENLVDAESTQRAYVETGEESLLADLPKTNAAIQMSFSVLAQDYADQPKSAAALDRLRAKVQARLAILSTSVALRRAGKIDQAHGVLMQNASSMAVVQSLDNELLAFEEERQAQRRQTVYDSLMVARVGIAIMIFLGLGMLLLFVHQARALLFHQNKLIEQELAARASLEAEVTLRTAELTHLSRYLMINREDERSRLARNLHDDLGALLTSAKLDVARLKTRMVKSTPDSMDLLARLVTSLNGCVALGRNIVENLRPSALDNLGLTATLDILTGEFAKNSGIQMHCEQETVALSPSAELMVYRVVQEALTNISRYAKATQVFVTLKVSPGTLGDEVLLEIQDNGCGFDTQDKLGTAYGLLGMRFRVEAEGGTLKIQSAPGQGTRIQARLNVKPASPAPLQG